MGVTEAVLSNTDFAVSAYLRALALSDPTRLAYDGEPATLTFAELNDHSDRVARSLLARCGRGDHRIVIRSRNYPTLAIAIMGTCRAGMIPVVQDPEVPDARLALVLQDLEASLMLTDSNGSTVAGVTNVDPWSLAAESGRRVRLPEAAATIATIMYTSGSTGAPKGIIQPGLTRDYCARRYALMGPPRHSPAIAWLGAVNWAFPWVMTATLEGETVHGYDVRARGVAGLPAWLRSHRIRSIFTVPTVLRGLIDALNPGEMLHDLEWVNLSGEPLQWSDVAGLRPHLPRTAVIVSRYGSTESGGLTAMTITADTELGTGQVALGAISSRCRVSILAADGTEVASGEPGEIVVDSPSCALGYWRQPELTAARFETLPNGWRRFHTGDGGRLLAGGQLIHLGRIDDVVKVSGHRIELGDVVAALRQLDGVDDATVVTYTDIAGATRLAGFIVGGADPAASRRQLASMLPPAMLPDRITPLDVLPQLPNGKVDRQRLIASIALTREVPAAPRAAASIDGPVPRRLGRRRRRSNGTSVPAPRTSGARASTPTAARPAPTAGSRPDLTETLCRLWAENLSRPEVGEDDNYFELGGDSLRASQLFARIHRELGYDRPISLLIEAPTPVALARRLAEGEHDWTTPLVINAGGSGSPLVVVHDGVGEVAYAYRMAQWLGPDHPVVAIRGSALSGRAPAQRTLPELAAAYVGRLRTLIPKGPYALYGSSLGGLIAFEMAVQLQTEGQQISLLAVGDTHWTSGTGSSFRAAPATDQPSGRSRLRAAVSHADVGGVGGAIVDHLRWRVGNLTRPSVRRSNRLLNVLRTGAPVPPDLRDLFCLIAYGRIARGYAPQRRFAGEPLLFRVGGPGSSVERAWADHCTMPARVVDVTCSHYELGTEAALNEIGPHLVEALRPPRRRD